MDTNALSAYVDGDSAVEPVVRGTAQIAIPVIVLGEYRFGIAQSRHRARYEDWLSEYLPAFRILEIDQHTAEHYADVRLELRKLGRPIPTNDVWIAALSRQHSLPILSRDRHFDGIRGITRLEW